MNSESSASVNTWSTRTAACSPNSASILAEARPGPSLANRVGELQRDLRGNRLLSRSQGLRCSLSKQPSVDERACPTRGPRRHPLERPRSGWPSQPRDRRNLHRPWRGLCPFIQRSTVYAFSSPKGLTRGLGTIRGGGYGIRVNQQDPIGFAAGSKH